jgi:hypothetical protein
MASVGRRVATRALEFLQAQPGLTDNLAALAEAAGLTPPEVGLKQYYTENVAQDLIDKSAGARYPAIHVYCEKYLNLLLEKFRTFSGRARVVIEIRVSQDRIEGIEPTLQLFADAVTRVLDQRRGDWGDGMFFGGAYEAAFGAVKHGGKNFVQAAKVEFDVEVSLD